MHVSQDGGDLLDAVDRMLGVVSNREAEDRVMAKIRLENSTFL